MQRSFLRIPTVCALALLSGCVAVSRREGAEGVEALLARRTPTTFAWSADADDRAASDARVAQLCHSPLSASGAVQIAWLRNPQMQAEYARLGISQANIVEASRIGNPSFSGSALKDRGVSKITTGISVPLSDLLLLNARKRFATGEYERAQLNIASALNNLAADVERDWFVVAGAEQVAAMRTAIARTAQASADLAQRFYAAGNLSALDLSVEQAAASQARIAATRARGEATRARLTLNAQMGLSGAQAQWTLDVPLAAPVANEDAVQTLQAMAREHRLDLSAAQREVDLLGAALNLVTHWRLLGTVNVGVEHEKDTDGSRLIGPTLSLALPLFNQGQAAIARARAQQDIARAHLAQLDLQIDNDVHLGVERVAAMRAIAEDYATALVPQREAIVKGQVERTNYMLIGTFELLVAKQQEYDAYQGYLEAVRDYWLARVELSRAIGTRLPSDAQIGDRTPSIDTFLAPPAGGTGHMHHGGAPMDGMPGLAPGTKDKDGGMEDMEDMEGMEGMKGMKDMQGMHHPAPESSSAQASGQSSSSQPAPPTDPEWQHLDPAKTAPPHRVEAAQKPAAAPPKNDSKKPPAVEEMPPMEGMDHSHDKPSAAGYPKLAPSGRQISVDFSASFDAFVEPTYFSASSSGVHP